LAAAIKDWELLDRAVEQEISDQRNLVDWWTEHVSKAHGGNRKIKFADRTNLIEWAEKLSGLPDHKVSKWRKALKGDLAKYAEHPS
jgi:hypothetical protein